MKIYTDLQNNLVYVDSMWFGLCGFVIAFDVVTKEYKAYLSDTKTHYVEDSSIFDKDIRIITEWGLEFPLDAATVLFKHIDFTSDIVIDNPEYFV